MLGIFLGNVANERNETFKKFMIFIKYLLEIFYIFIVSNIAYKDPEHDRDVHRERTSYYY